MPRFDITAVVNGHREGLLAQATLRSVLQAVNRARQSGLRAEILLVLDRAGDDTRAVFDEFSAAHDSCRTLVVDHGDLGKSRNSACQAAESEWMAFVDADDLWGADWLTAASSAAAADDREVVWHPEISLYFPASPQIWKHPDCEDPDFRIENLAISNFWTAHCFARRDLFLRCPYDVTNLAGQIGFEDWSWNMKVFAAGGLHKIVHGTSHAIRVKTTSLLKQTKAADCLPSPTTLFRTIIGGGLPMRPAFSATAIK